MSRQDGVARLRRAVNAGYSQAPQSTICEPCRAAGTRWRTLARPVFVSDVGAFGMDGWTQGSAPPHRLCIQSRGDAARRALIADFWIYAG